MSIETPKLAPNLLEVEDKLIPNEALLDESADEIEDESDDDDLYKSSNDWPLDYEEAYRRLTGIYTVVNATTLLQEEPLELINGWLVWKSMTNLNERAAASIILGILLLACRRFGFGLAYMDLVECLMANGDVYKPDVCLISTERAATLVQPIKPASKKPPKTKRRKKYVHKVLNGSPELVIELRSPSNRRIKELRKREAYFANGALQVWDVDTNQRKIWVYEAATPAEPTEYNVGDEISCQPLLPGWKHAVEDFFNPNITTDQLTGEVGVQMRAEGEAKGTRQTILVMAQTRFGQSLPPDLPARLERCSVEQLLTATTAIITAKNLDEWLISLPE